MLAEEQTLEEEVLAEEQTLEEEVDARIFLLLACCSPRFHHVYISGVYYFRDSIAAFNYTSLEQLIRLLLLRVRECRPLM